MNAASQAILTLAEQQTGSATQIASDVASGFAAAIGYYLQHVGTIIDYIVGTAADMAGLSDPAGLPLAANVLADLIADTPTATQPLSPSFAATFISAGSDSAVSLLLAVAGKINDAQFAFDAGQQIAGGINFVRFSNYFPTTLTTAVQNNVLSNAQAVLIMGSVLPSTAENHLGPQGTADFINTLAGFTIADPTTVAAIGAAVAAGYFAPEAVETLGFIGGGVPSLQSAVQSQIVSIVQSGANSITGDEAIASLIDASRITSFISGLSTSAATALVAATQAGLGADIAALISNGLATATGAVTDIGNFVGAFLGSLPSIAAVGVSLLEYLATNDSTYFLPGVGGVAGLEVAAQSEISQIVTANEIGAATVVTELQNLQAGLDPSAPLFQVTSNEIGILDANPATLDSTVGTGTAAQIQGQAAAVAALLTETPYRRKPDSERHRGAHHGDAVPSERRGHVSGRSRQLPREPQCRRQHADRAGDTGLGPGLRRGADLQRHEPNLHGDERIAADAQ